jgi:alkylated DNA repair protein alkB family protein 1
MYPKEEEKSTEFSEFKKAEKHYRYYIKKKTDFSELIDLSNYSSKYETICKPSEIKDPKTGKIYPGYNFLQPEGVHVIKNFLTIEEQLMFCQKCLNEYHKKPNRTNLYIYEEGAPEYPEGTLPTYEMDKFLVADPQKYYFNKKIRWSNVGYQYDWNNRMYPSGGTLIPDELKSISLRVTEMMQLGSYTPESVIINYYDKRNYMGGHLDDGEKDQVSPIISFSFGLSCVFLMGGPTKDIKPHAIKLNSGDVLVMSGKSRICYHGVPRVLEDTFEAEPYLNYVKETNPKVFETHLNTIKKEDGSFENDVLHTIEYLGENRLNFNFRQVDKQAPLIDNSCLSTEPLPN